MALDPSIPVLVVDDYSTMVRIIRNLLGQLGFADVDDARDGQSALAKMHTRRYGLVISDWNMEPMTGYDLLRQVRADPGLGEIPFIMVTAESKTENVIAAKKAGVSNYIVKPFDAQSQDRGGVRREGRGRRGRPALTRKPTRTLTTKAPASPRSASRRRRRRWR
jgi:two-component system, chemotaxis family, chemotaxis protein CheY